MIDLELARLGEGCYYLGHVRRDYHDLTSAALVVSVAVVLSLHCFAVVRYFSHRHLICADIIYNSTTASLGINPASRTMFLSRSASTRSCYRSLPSTDSVFDQSQPLTKPETTQPAQRPTGLRRTSSLRRGAQQLKRGSSNFAERTNPFALHSVVEEVDLRVAGGWW